MGITEMRTRRVRPGSARKTVIGKGRGQTRIARKKLRTGSVTASQDRLKIEAMKRLTPTMTTGEKAAITVPKLMIGPAVARQSALLNASAMVQAAITQLQTASATTIALTLTRVTAELAPKSANSSISIVMKIAVMKTIALASAWMTASMAAVKMTTTTVGVVVARISSAVTLTMGSGGLIAFSLIVLSTGVTGSRSVLGNVLSATIATAIQTIMTVWVALMIVLMLRSNFCHTYKRKHVWVDWCGVL